MGVYEFNLYFTTNKQMKILAFICLLIIFLFVEGIPLDDDQESHYVKRAGACSKITYNICAKANCGCADGKCTGCSTIVIKTTKKPNKVNVGGSFSSGK